ncbi:hypothetical protein H6P81_008405 [Aristolochia fimbriata]|uniref:Uncharacterized protein n=1 Tax=Aristolochia fimbriata TaxID=158543 RepID=A0AAV7EHW9_ARIFI|nr:hypothetical protein H6P81_008405 [Aristolochia fimbriata]
MEQEGEYLIGIWVLEGKISPNQKKPCCWVAWDGCRFSCPESPAFASVGAIWSVDRLGCLVGVGAAACVWVEECENGWVNRELASLIPGETNLRPQVGTADEAPSCPSTVCIRLDHSP